MTNGTHYCIVCDGADDASNTVTNGSNITVIWRKGSNATHPGNEFYTNSGWPSGTPGWNADPVGYNVIFYVYSLI
jgi:hypothetical protein